MSVLARQTENLNVGFEIGMPRMQLSVYQQQVFARPCCRSSGDRSQTQRWCALVSQFFVVLLFLLLLFKSSQVKGPTLVLPSGSSES